MSDGLSLEEVGETTGGRALEATEKAVALRYTFPCPSLKSTWKEQQIGEGTIGRS
jgi:hypothetical protein